MLYCMIATHGTRGILQDSLSFLHLCHSLVLDRAIQNLNFETRRDHTSVAVTVSDNSDRGINGKAAIDFKRSSARPDLVLYRNGIEYGAAEGGNINDDGMSKIEIVESHLHCPKVLKNMLDHAAAKAGENNEQLVRPLRVIGFYQFRKLYLSAC
ncbi:hypothetical protein BDB00DRAFT_792336 [Zychaea mexicana]|uniref:uncharacterized protein n=1 Tax=Zychaea mexicana TaxID=64656 RepID=UPI0022FE687E|nr:uncharacterized protein BDB00DRAFT_792336 [Zychaea mexicana]KAI9485155.1 hypothetical protein BDB00DRAFT_792336 [Zychaea mexicana]